MIRPFLILSVLLGSLTLAAIPAGAAPAADASSVPDIIGRGLQAYAEDGAEAAIRAWVAGGPLDTDEFAMTQASGLRRIESFYGKYQAAEHIRTSEITPRLRAVYLTLYFEKGAAFCYLLCYRTSVGDWVVGDFDGSTSPRRILPEFGATAAPLLMPPAAEPRE